MTGNDVMSSLWRAGSVWQSAATCEQYGARPGHSCNGRDDEINFCGAPTITEHVTACDGANLKRTDRSGLEGSHQFVQRRGLCGSELPASRLLQTVGDEWGQASRPIVPGSLQSAGSWEGPRRTAGFHRESERHCSLQEAKDGSDDARPACSGETIRRIIGKP